MLTKISAEIVCKETVKLRISESSSARTVQSVKKHTHSLTICSVNAKVHSPSSQIEQTILFPDVSYFPTCQVRVVRFYVNSRSFSSFSSSSSPDLNYDDHSRVFAAGPQPRPATPSVRCRTSTTTSHAQCSLPDLNHDHPRPVFAAGPQPRPATPSVRCRTSTTTIHAQCSLPDLNSYAKSYAR